MEESFLREYLPIIIFLGLAIALGVITIGNQSTAPNPPAGLLLLGLGLVAPGLLAALALASPALWDLLIDGEADAAPTRKHLYAFLAVGAAGLAMAGVALQRLL